MNQNLHILLDQLTVASTESKSEIISIMASEGCFPARGLTNSIALTVLKIITTLGGKQLVKRSSKKLLLKDEERAEAVFFSIIDEIVMNESLSLIQDFLCAVHLSKWKFDVEDARRYMEKILVQTAYPK